MSTSDSSDSPRRARRVRTVVRTFTIPAELSEAIDAQAEMRGGPENRLRSRVVVDALRRYFAAGHDAAPHDDNP
jgi:hypothetical protein